MFRPSSPYVPLWQAHQTSTKSVRYCTVQPRCVHTADTQWYSPSAVRSNNAGRLPNRKTFELFALRSPTLPATTSSWPRSGTAGGTRYFSTGYKNDTTDANIPPPRRSSTRRRLAGRTCWDCSIAIEKVSSLLKRPRLSRGESVLLCQLSHESDHLRYLLFAQLGLIRRHFVFSLGDNLRQFRVA